MRAALVVVTFLGWAQAAQAGEAKKLKYVVNGLTPQGGVSADAANMITSQVCADLSQLGDYDVLCADELKALIELEHRKLDLNACDSDNCLKSIGQLAKADRLVVGTLGKLDKVIMLQINVIDPNTGKALARASEKAEGDVSSILEKIKPALQKLFKPAK